MGYQRGHWGLSERITGFQMKWVLFNLSQKSNASFFRILQYWLFVCILVYLVYMTKNLPLLLPVLQNNSLLCPLAASWKTIFRPTLWQSKATFLSLFLFLFFFRQILLASSWETEALGPLGLFVICLLVYALKSRTQALFLIYTMKRIN